MFDGNHRSRRPVNLGGRRNNKKKPEGRTNILEQTKRLRQERMEQQQRTKAATCLQRHVRGWLRRMRLCHDLYQSVLQQQQHSVDLTLLTMQVNVLLRLLLRRTRKNKHAVTQTAADVLRCYLSMLPSSPSNNVKPLLYTKYIWRQTLILLQQQQQQQPSSLEDAQQILQYALPASNHPNAWTLLGMDGLVLLCETCLQLPQFSFLWTYVQQIMPQPQGHALLGVLQWLGECSPQQGAAATTTRDTRTLEALVQTISTSSTSLLDQAAARLLLSKDANLLRLLNAVLDHQSKEQQNPTSHSTLLVVPLVSKVWQRYPYLVHATSLVARHGPQALKAKLPGLDEESDDKMEIDNINGGESDSDDDDDDSNIHVTTKSVAVENTRGTASMLGMRVTTKQDILTTPKLERLSCQTRDEWVKEQQGQLQKKQHADLVTSVATRLSQSQLWLGWARVLLSTTQEHDPKQTAARHALVTCLAALLQGQHTGLYPRTSASSPLLTQLAFHQEQQTGSTTTTGGKLLVEQLWRYVLVLDHNDQHNNSKSNSLGSDSADAMEAQIHALSTWSIFCDVFAQQLIAVRDDQFLQQHAVPQDYDSASTAQKKQLILMDNNNTKKMDNVILAEHVIARLRHRLYELYWSQPVLTHETKATLLQTLPAAASAESRLAAARVRLFLTGTKLWNSLYERWCRLLRHGAPFCDESAWLFPTLTSLTFGDGIVRRPDGAVNDDMDVDEETDDDDEEDAARQSQNTLGNAQEEDAEALAGAFQDPKMARILTSIPQCMPFERRVKLFHTLLQVDKSRTQDESDEMRATMLAMMRGEEFESNVRVHVEIRRDSLYQDSMQQLNQLGPKLKKKVKVSFINQHGQPEAGIDGGGVFKEFLDDLIKEAFTPPTAGTSTPASAASLQLFAVTPLETLMVNPSYTKDVQFLSHYEFLGRAVGKAVYESILVEPQFCLPFLNTLLGKSNTLEDLKNYDPEYYASLVKLIGMNRQDIASTGLTFEVNLGSASEAVELLPGGSQKAVTKDNVIQYAHLISHRLLNVQGALQVRAFLRGFRDLIPAAWVRLFSAHELQKLVSGDDSSMGIDVASFQASMTYAAGYHPSQPAMKMFWEILEEMSPEQQAKFLKFMTSCSRQPLLGFSSLEPPPCIQQVRLPQALLLESPSELARQSPLPTAATCMNLLKLPNYGDKALMRQKILAAIESGAGFELS